ncbi:uncharacterized protein Z519_04572 [Cladophialophora bantiana CBS 173.52]|uniref:N-alpha-acetyltransferase 40 n=1 Tax=Cladophialophora bantiana (strain ATCC 10958 / CBS 173.52 / CDC B-1940 / NIH 8579) TaxID=1442370 RepID=A0A0D2EXG2_CLAB1|nr:uncharacterized protein Z519_04572 [Cladophialophora bantiana CBS 173.52]KIW94596.1 hypothetical protein Z519_04572 [Cladophialophora bantiana CBS 173.52]
MADPQHQERRSLRSRLQGRAIAERKLVETVNALSAPDFFAKYAPPELMTELGNCHSELELSSLQADAANVPSGWLEACLKLIEETSAQDYQNSEIKWSTSKKRKEMKLPDMKYIILFHGTSHLVGFISFMITYEDGYEVLYVYEIHFTPEWQGKGIGKKLMKIVEVIGQNVGITKIMLTAFRANRRAVGWYTQLSYEEDDFSPGPRKLRNGTVKEPSHIILSKQVKR